MSKLPFEQEDKNARKWQCFVCGRAYPNFDDFKAHILEKHEQGREFVICPLERCGAPVRDVKMHFKAKHPTEKCPGSGQMKAIIWKDFSTTGKKKTRKPTFRDGSMFSNKNGIEMKYRSGLECEFYELLEAIPSVMKYSVEPFAIPYLFNGEQHKYHPDLIIHFSNGETEVWEIKPASQTSLPINEAKWRSANQFCEARGITFVVQTEVALGKLRKLAQRLNEQTQQE